MNAQLENKHILVDTCFISSLFYEEIDFFKNLLDLFEQNHCTLCINTLICLEFLRIAKGKSEKEELSDFLHDKFFELGPDISIYDCAKELFPLYNFCKSIGNKKQASVVDIVNVCFLKKYSENLLLLTLDNYDYPLEITDRINVGVIDLKKELLTWGIYKFNNTNFTSLLNHYNEK
jgi:hypothetical protein